MATCAVLGISPLALAAVPAEEGTLSVIPARTCLTISSILAELISMFNLLFSYLIHKLSDITHLLRLVNVLADVKPSPVLDAMVKVQYPSPPKPSAA